MLGDDAVLEHHSALDEEEEKCRADRDKLKLARENWDAPVVVTTNVQLFESLFSHRPSRCRKLHNIARSVIVLDEAQTLPRPFLIPIMRAIKELANNYGASVVLCTATQPALGDTSFKTHRLELEGRELAPNPAVLSQRLRRTRLELSGEMDNEALVVALAARPQALTIVNSRAHALDLFNEARDAGLEGVIHLTTRQYAIHRRRILADVRRRLTDGQPCRLIATSLVEAGVDLDFPCAFRAEAGLDQLACGGVDRNLAQRRAIMEQWVAPPAGRGSKLALDLGNSQSLPVAPPAGAWIETWTTSRCTRSEGGRSPCGGVDRNRCPSASVTVM